MANIKKLLSLLFVCSIIGAIGYFLILPKLVPLGYQKQVEQYAAQYELEPSLVYAVIFCESRYDANAVSHAGAKGLMQIGDDTALWAAQQIDTIDVEQMNIFDPDTNIQIGCWYLHWLLEKFDHVLPTSLAGYNAGHNKVAQWLSDEQTSKNGITLDEIPYQETDQYIKKVLVMKRVYETRYGV